MERGEEMERQRERERERVLLNDRNGERGWNKIGT